MPHLSAGERVTSAARTAAAHHTRSRRPAAYRRRAFLLLSHAMAVDYDELSMKKITGTAKFEVDRAYLLLEVTQSNQVDADGLQHQVQVSVSVCVSNSLFNEQTVHQIISSLSFFFTQSLTSFMSLILPE